MSGTLAWTLGEGCEVQMSGLDLEWITRLVFLHLSLHLGISFLLLRRRKLGSFQAGAGETPAHSSLRT